MVNVAPVPLSFADRDVQAIVDSYKDEPGNPKYAFKYLLFSVTEPQFRVKPAGVSDIMWAEAMGKLEGMESAVENVCGLNLFKIQDEVIVSDAERLLITQSNVKMVMRIVEALEGKGCRIPLTKGDAELAEKLATITRQLKGSGTDLSRRVQNILMVSRVQTSGIGFGGSVYLPGLTKIHEQSLADLQEVLQQQTEAIARLGSVLMRDIRDMEIMMAENTGATENGNST